MAESRPSILLTNDDGIRSPGLWAAAEALSALGFVTVVAPREQQSGSGRSMPLASDGAIGEETVDVGGKTWTVYSVGGSPAQAVQHAVFEIMPRPPDLVVAGINYGENVTTSVTISGTVGAALEAAASGVAAMAVSLETEARYHLTHDEEVDFMTAAHFTAFFAGRILSSGRPADVDVLKIDVPKAATPATPWRLTRLSRARYYVPVVPDRRSLSDRGVLSYRVDDKVKLEPGTDAYVLRVDRQVSVTPLSLDMTSRVDFTALDARLRAD
jgi:5'-nucleotidase